jgi:hypothetical protein
MYPNGNYEEGEFLDYKLKKGKRKDEWILEEGEFNDKELLTEGKVTLDLFNQILTFEGKIHEHIFDPNTGKVKDWLGKGTITTVGFIYRGEMKSLLAHGRGKKYHIQTGKSESGLWENGELKKSD